MKMAEAEARVRGCRNAFLETFSFQALPFYEKCGYTIFSTLRDMPPGGARYALTRKLMQDHAQGVDPLAFEAPREEKSPR